LNLLVIGLNSHIRQHRNHLSVERFQLHRLLNRLLPLGELSLHRLIAG